MTEKTLVSGDLFSITHGSINCFFLKAQEVCKTVHPIWSSQGFSHRVTGVASAKCHISMLLDPIVIAIELKHPLLPLQALQFDCTLIVSPI